MIRAAGSPEFERVVSKQRSICYVIYRGDKPNNNIYFVRTYSWAELIERRQTKQQYILVFRANVHSWAALIKNLSWDVLFLIFLFCIWMFNSSLFVMLMTYIYIYIRVHTLWGDQPNSSLERSSHIHTAGEYLFAFKLIQLGQSASNMEYNISITEHCQYNVVAIYLN